MIRRRILAGPVRSLLVLAALALPGPAMAWGDDGHRIVALIAERHLTPTAAAKVADLLKGDPDTLTLPDIASRATWADRYRESDRSAGQQRYRLTRNWHFVDLELDSPDLAKACHGHQPAAVPASAGPEKACIVDRLSAFAAELRDLPGTDPERLLALKFVLHFAGDLHQPLHAADNHDRGGNDVIVRTDGTPPQPLHNFWDVNVVAAQGADPVSVAAALDQKYAHQCAGWMTGGPADWAMETFAVGRDVAYRLPAKADGPIVLDSAYQTRSAEVAGAQLAKAGCRLAMVLNQALQ